MNKKKQIKILLLIFICGFMAAIALGVGFHKVDRQRIANEFHKDVVQIALSAERDVKVTFEALNTLSGLFSGSSEIGYPEFQALAETVIARHPSIRQIEWAPLVKNSRRVDFERSAQSYSPGFSFKELDESGGLRIASARDEYLPIIYAQPQDDGGGVLGLDLASDLQRFRLLTKSRDSKQMLVSDRTDLIEYPGDGKDYYFVFVPVFAGGESGSSQGFRGFVIGVFKVGDIIKNSLHGLLVDDIKVSVQKFTHTESVEQIFTVDSVNSRQLQHDMAYSYQQNIAGNNIIYSAIPTVEYVQVRSSNSAYISFFFSVLLTIIVCGFTRLLQQKILVIGLQAEHLGRANLELERMSRIDGLTKVANRRYFDEILAREWRLASRNSKPIALIMIDIDYFKLYNDSYGHQAGDACLQKVAAALERSVRRPTDLVARYGGEEFVVILPDTDNKAIFVAQKCCESVRALAIPHKASLVGANVTISLGVSFVLPNPQYDSARLLKEADTALYRAKENGRDMVNIWQRLP